MNTHSNIVHGKTKKDTIPREPNGVYNLISLVALLSIFRYLIEDYKDYGLIMKIPLRELTLRDSLFFTLNFLISLAFSLLCFAVERSRVGKVGKKEKPLPPSSFYTFIFIVFLASLNLATVFVCYFYIEHVYISGWALISSVVVSVKLLSFFLVSNELQITLDLRHFLYFLVCPTLCYQSQYPMNETRRYKRIALRAVQLIGGVFLFVFVMDQYSISSIYRAIENNDYLIKIENTINVAISTAFLFLIFFHMVFVCALDIIAEITLFQDRQFYQSWWNSTTVGEFWSLWNIPVHNCFKRHLYIPLIKNGTSKQVARAYCFFVSAVLHEFVLSVATKKFCGWVFLGMIFQIPNIYVSELVNKHIPSLANYFFWCSFCVIGQPTIVILYYRSKYLRSIE
ncbi:Diacylglycerol O-acyltransferase 1C [Nosema granulosis]|uniref:diacylglycerol O-acyltransferase n=1 Tax=Nosema granulosis TaxID=83296 RepID=A0A9P6L039_9MICR|nr:Diacylglycerol O-acyltransferase 1C [Nosema granulosis]